MNSEKWIEYGKYWQIDKPQCGRPKRAELPDVNINTGTQSITTERTSLTQFELISANFQSHQDKTNQSKPQPEA